MENNRPNLVIFRENYHQNDTCFLRNSLTFRAKAANFYLLGTCRVKIHTTKGLRSVLSLLFRKHLFNSLVTKQGES